MPIFANVEKGARVQRLEKRLKNVNSNVPGEPRPPRVGSAAGGRAGGVANRGAGSNPPPLNQIGALLTEQTQRAFFNRPQGRKGGPTWVARSVPNVMGIINRANRGLMPQRRHFADSPVLIDTGNLARSFSWRPEGKDTVVIGTSVPYASLHQFGGESTLPITARARQIITWHLKMVDDPAQWRRFAFIYDTDEVTTTVPARPFLMVTDEDKKLIGRLLGVRIAEVGTGRVQARG